MRAAGSGRVEVGLEVEGSIRSPRRWRARAERLDATGDEAVRWGSVVRPVRAVARWDVDTARLVIGGLLLGVVLTAAGQAATAEGSAVVRYGLSALNTVSIMALALVCLGRWARVRPETFRRVAFVSAVLLGFIILTGAAVRLTGSGLGCVDWPTCNNGSITPELSDVHGLIEFGNRVVTGLCVLAAGIGVLATLVRVPYRRDLVRPAVVVVVAIMSNAVLGGLMVQQALPPTWVLSHFLLAIVALAAGLVLFHRSGESSPTPSLSGRSRQAAFGSTELWLGRVMSGSALLTLFLGTIVTGSGPHAGDEAAERLGFAMHSVARLHSVSAWCSLVTVVALVWRAWRAPLVLVAPRAAELRRRLHVLVAVVVLQGAVGYVQWFTQVPAGLVFVHIIGAVTFWCAVLWVRAALTVPPSEGVGRGSAGSATLRAATV